MGNTNYGNVLAVNEEILSSLDLISQTFVVQRNPLSRVGTMGTYQCMSYPFDLT